MVLAWLKLDRECIDHGSDLACEEASDILSEAANLAVLADYFAVDELIGSHSSCHDVVNNSEGLSLDRIDFLTSLLKRGFLALILLQDVNWT